MEFTLAQIATIEAIVEKMIAGRLPQSKVTPARLRDYHRVPEIRLLISTHIDAIKEEIGDCEFDLHVLRFVLKKHTKLRLADEEWMESSGCTRFDNQVSNAIQSNQWVNGCPIESASKPRKYRFTKSNQPSLFTQAQ